MQQEVSRRRDRFNELMQQVEAIEDRVSDELGLTAVLRDGQALGAERDAAVSGGRRRRRTSCSPHQKELLRLTGTQNEFYEQALARMQSFLASLPPARLAAESRTTPEREDDAIVAEVPVSQRRAGRGRSALFAARPERRAWDERLGGLQSVLQRFRQAEFDSRRSLFAGDLDAQALVAAYLARPTGRRGAVGDAPAASAVRPGVARADAAAAGGGVNYEVVGDVSQVLLHVLTEVAGAAMRHAAQRGMERRAPTRSSHRKAVGRPSFPNRGFTNGRGF